MSNFELPKGIVANRTIMMTGNVDGMRADITPKKMERIRIDAIDVGDRKRKPNQVDVKRIYEDIASQGLLQPIGVKEMGYGRYLLLYGFHRLEAFRMGLETAVDAAVVDWETIPAVVYEMEMPAWAAELKEISENLFRKNLSQSELEEHRVRYAAILKRNNLTVEERIKPGPKAKGDNSYDKSYLKSEKPSVLKKMEADLGVSPATVTKDFRQVSQRAKAVARTEGKPEPKAVKPTSPVKDIEAAVELSERHTRAKAEAVAKGENPRAVMPIEPQAFTVMTVRIDFANPNHTIEWFKARLVDPNKPVTADYIRKLAEGLLKLVGD